MVSKYRYILLDIDDTLLDFASSEYIAMTSSCEHFELDFSEELLSTFRIINHDLWTKYERKEVTLNHLRHERFRKLISCVDPDIEVDEFGSHFIKKLVASPVLVEGAKELCAYLGRNFTVCLLSNGVREVQEERIVNAGIEPLVHGLIVSEDIGHGKPAPEIYDYALRKLGVSDRTSVLMIGDSLSSDIAGGINFGIDTCWYNPHHRPQPNPAPTYQVGSLKEIPALLGE